MSSPNSDLTSYSGNCHCAAVTFTVRTPSLSDNKVDSCDCSICSRNGYLHIYPKRTDVDFHTGYDHMVSYLFGDKQGAHKFCPTCGSSVLVDFEGEDQLALNARLIRDIDAKELELNEIDGKQSKPEYKEPKITIGSEPHLSTSGLTPYHANCHCGQLTYTVYIQSLTAHKVNSCNCSICTRTGYLCVYPERQDVIFHTGYDRLSTYSFGNMKVTHKFCPTCGSSILADFNGKIPLGGVDQLGINVRMFQDVDLKELKLYYFDGRSTLKPEYVVGK